MAENSEIEGRSAIDIDVRETMKDGTGTLSKVRLRFTSVPAYNLWPKNSSITLGFIAIQGAKPWRNYENEVLGSAVMVNEENATRRSYPTEDGGRTKDRVPRESSNISSVVDSLSILESIPVALRDSAAPSYAPHSPNTERSARSARSASPRSKSAAILAHERGVIDDEIANTSSKDDTTAQNGETVWSTIETSLPSRHASADASLE
uniref:Uncharacterized protein n=1 Tax=Vespula pensylvanica TaxID=30213 RepID=A0A834UFF3_VESPE|nr:hypothetical protein H0235_000037 [Vespula pensylvanica]